jgi:hypothetical protein
MTKHPDGRMFKHPDGRMFKHPDVGADDRDRPHPARSDRKKGYLEFLVAILYSTFVLH